MAFYECNGVSNEEPESIIITLVPDTNTPEQYAYLFHIYFYIDDTLIATYSHNGNYFWSNKSVTINTIANISFVGNPQSIQLGINGNVVKTLGAGGNYFIHNAIVYKYTFS